MFGLSFGELVIVAVLALVLLGPDRLPGAAKAIAKTLKDLQKATDGLKVQIESELHAVEKSINGHVNAPPVVSEAAAAIPRPPQPALPATVANVPGLEAALVETAPVPAPPTTSQPDSSRTT
jgi:sec-independent protein translocase protein TatB